VALFTAILLAVSTLAACTTVIVSFEVQRQSREAAFWQYQGQQLSLYDDRRRQLEEIGFLVEDIAGAEGLYKTMATAARPLRHRLIGQRGRLPSCERLLTDVEVNGAQGVGPLVEPARQEILRELTVVAMAEEIVEKRRLSESRLATWLHRNRSRLPYPEATAP
jgi:hypothetical protein